MTTPASDLSLAPIATSDLVSPRRALLAGIGGLAAGAFLASKAAAGPLNPPAGPVTSTGKTLTEVEPRTAINSTNTPGSAAAAFRITQPGSYYLTGNILADGKAAIEITASRVTLDLSGFSISGTNSAPAGIRVTAAFLYGITIRSGNVFGFAGPGVTLVLDNNDLGGHLVENIGVYSCSGIGVDVPRGSVVRNVLTDYALGGGISALDHCEVSGCTVTRATAGAGIRVLNASRVIACIASQNSGGNGIAAGSFSTVEACTTEQNASHGIGTSNSCTVTNCSSTNNGSAGISVGNDGRVVGCAVSINTGVGITANARGRIEACVAHFNGSHGIIAGGASLVIGNDCYGNGLQSLGAGVAASSDCRIEGNNCAANDWGLNVSATGNLICRNTCADNTTANYVIAASNRYGPIVNITAAGSAAVSGNAAAGTLTSTDPFANFAY